MADYLATALVRVRPDTSGFTEALRSDLKKRIGGLGTFRVPVTAEMKVFKQKLDQDLKRNPIRVPVVPDMTGFQEELRRRVAASAKGVKAKVQVEVQKPSVVRGPGVGAVDPLGNVTTISSTEAAIRKRNSAEAESAAIAREATRTERELQIAQQDRARAQVVLAESTTVLERQQLHLQGVLGSATKEETILTALDAEQATAQRALAAAITTGNVAREKELALLIEGNVAKRADVATTVQQNLATKAAADAQAKQAASMAFVRRGALATSLSFLKVRGATLAANQSFLAGAAAVAIFAKSVKLAADLQENLNVFAETAGATADEMDRVAGAARQLGADVTLPSVSAGDAAEAMTGLAKAGLSVQESISGARGVLQLATAAQISNADATELSASALNAFGLSGGQAAHVADLLTGSANATQGSITDIGIALQQSSAVARQANLSLEDTVALLSLLAKNGIRGSDAGTSLRTAILRLIAPTKQALKVLDELGIVVQDAQGNFRPEVFDEFARANERFSDRQAATNARIVFGQDAIRAYSIAAREGVAGLDAMRAKTDDFGAAQRLAEARTQGLSGAVNGLVSNLETLGTNVGSFTLGPLSALAKGLTEATGDINLMIEQIVRLEGLVGRIKVPDVKFDVGPVHIESDSASLGDKAGHAFGVAFGNAARVGVVSRVVPLPVAVGLVAARKFLNDTKSISANAEETREKVKLLFEEFQKAPGPSSRSDLIVGLKALSSELAQGDQASQRFGRAIDDAISKIQDAGRIPPPDLSHVFGPAGERGAVSFLDGLLKGLDDPAKISDGADIVANNLVAALPPKLADAFNRTFDIIEGIVQKRTDSIVQQFPEGIGRISSRFEEALLNAEISGNRSRELQILREKEADIQASLDRGVKDRTKRLKLKQELKSVQDDIQSIQDGITSDAKAAATKIKDAQSKADQAVLDSISLEEHKRQNAVARAALTARLSDDIAANEALRQFYVRALADVKRTVKDATTRANQIAALTGQLIAAEDAVAKARKERADARKKRRQDALDKAEESRQLSIQIAQATGNKAKEERARKAEIKALEIQIRHTREGSLQRKRLILALRQQQKELRDLQKERAKTTDEFKKLAFQFLTTQQGFAANLFSNILGAPQAAGTVGRPSPPPVPTAAPAVGAAAGAAAGVLGGKRRTTPETGLDRATERADAQTGGGITKGQAATLVHLMRKQLKILTDIHKDQGHPESRTRRIQQRTSTETGRD